jgi:SnoaL-like domain
VSKTMRLFAMTLAGGAVVVMATHAQQGATPPSGQAPAFTAADYIEIQQLVARYAYALDTQGGSGSAYADLFTPDGVYGARKVANSSRRSPEPLSHNERGPRIPVPL